MFPPPKKIYLYMFPKNVFIISDCEYIYIYIYIYIYAHTLVYMYISTYLYIHTYGNIYEERENIEIISYNDKNISFP